MLAWPTLTVMTPVEGSMRSLNPRPVPGFTLNWVSTSPDLRMRVYTPGRSLSWLATVYSLPLLMMVPLSV